MSAPKEQGDTPNRRPRAAQRPAASVNMEVLRDNGLGELELENEGFRVRRRRESPSGQPAAQTAEVPLPPPPAQPAPPPAGGPSQPGKHASTDAPRAQDL